MSTALVADSHRETKDSSRLAPMTWREFHQVGETASIRVVVLARSPVFAQGLQALVDPGRDGIEVIATASAVSQLPDDFGQDPPDVVVLHLDDAGLADQPLAGTVLDGAKVVVIAEPSAQPAVAAALHRRASAFLETSITSGHLISAIRLVKAGHTVLSSGATSMVVQELKHGRTSLSEEERNLLALVARAIDNDGIAHQMAMSTATVKRRLRRIQEKLGVTTRIEAVIEAAKKGWI